jgi:hypothetical protein
LNNIACGCLPVTSSAYWRAVIILAALPSFAKGLGKIASTQGKHRRNNPAKWPAAASSGGELLLFAQGGKGVEPTFVKFGIVW